jgi:hypothetical protein
MLDGTVLLLTFTDQYRWGFSGKNGIFLNCSTDVDNYWHGAVSQVFKDVLRYDIYKGANIGGICAANREIIEIAETYLPKYVIYPCNFSGIVTEATFTMLRRMGCIVVADFFDDDVYFEPLSRWMLPCIDYVVTHVRGLVAEYERLGARCILSPAIPMNPSILRRLNNLDKLYDATFVGSLYSYRRDYLTDIAAHGAMVSYLGGGNESKIHSARMVKIFNQSRINLNFSSGQAGRRIIVGRVFEVPLCSGFLLTEYFPGLERLFEIGREIECFETAQEAAGKIKYYLKHSDEREQIATRGYERAHREYTGPVLLSRVFREIEDDLCRRGRPELIPPASGVNTLRQTYAEKYYKWVRALLKSPPPLRDEWHATANLVHVTNPEHKAAERLLQRAKKFGDPEPLVGRMRMAAYRVLSMVSYCVEKAEHLSSAALCLVKSVIRKIQRALGGLSRF